VCFEIIEHLLIVLKDMEEIIRARTNICPERLSGLIIPKNYFEAGYD